MRVNFATLDSINLSAAHLESIFIYNRKHYSIETVKSRSTFNPTVWSRAFGKSLKRHIIEAKIIHTHLGLKLPLKVFAVSPLSQTLELAGLHGYNERSQLLVQTLRELEDRLQHTRIMRIDIAIDYKGKIPQSIVKALSKNRKPFEWKNTTYYKTAKEKKTNRVMDIKIYNKQIQAGLNYPLYRLEFCFKSEYFKRSQFKDIEAVYKKMEKSIKKATGLGVQIQHILDPKK